HLDARAAIGVARGQRNVVGFAVIRLEAGDHTAACGDDVLQLRLEPVARGGIREVDWTAIAFPPRDDERRSVGALPYEVAMRHRAVVGSSATEVLTGDGFVVRP